MCAPLPSLSKTKKNPNRNLIIALFVAIVVTTAEFIHRQTRGWRTETAGASGRSKSWRRRRRKKPFSPFFGHCVRSLSSRSVGGTKGSYYCGEKLPSLPPSLSLGEAHCDYGIEKQERGKGKGGGAGDRTVSPLSVVTCNFALFRSRPEKKREKGMSRSSTTLGMEFATQKEEILSDGNKVLRNFNF